jgi:hypothetical protein
MTPFLEFLSNVLTYGSSILFDSNHVRQGLNLPYCAVLHFTVQVEEENRKPSVFPLPNRQRLYLSLSE